MKYDNIFICMTPFQLFLAKKIIENQKLENVKVILVSYFFNSKYENYFNELKENGVDVCLYRVENKNKIYLFFSYFRILKFFSLREIDSIFISSIDNYFIHILLSIIRFNNIYTFDDGLANINYNGIYYQKRSLSFLKINSEKIKKLSKTHYTIYKNSRNIVDQSKIKYLNIFDCKINLCEKTENIKILKIFLGQPVDKIKNGISSDQLKKILYDISKKDNIFYFPHPSESKRYEFFPYIETNKLFEDYILEYISTHKIIVYTFFSSAVKNLQNCDAIEFNLIYTENLFNDFKELYLSLGSSINTSLVKVTCEN